MFVRHRGRRRTRSTERPTVNGLGQPGTSILHVPVPHFECAPAIVAEFNASGNSLTCADLRKDLETDAGGAAAMAQMGVLLVESTKPAHQAAFASVFGIDRDALIPGTPWKAGGVIKARYAGVLKLLKSGGLLYSFGIPRQGGGPESPSVVMNYQFKARAGQLWVALGGMHFLTNDLDRRASDVLAAAIIAAYGEWVFRTSAARPLNNLFCHLKFIFDAWGFEAPEWVTDHCSIST